MKFGNPAVMQKFVGTPTNFDEWRIFAWPLWVAYPLFGLLLLSAIPALRITLSRSSATTKSTANKSDVANSRLGIPRWLVIAALSWLGWQFVATTRSVDSQLSVSVVIYFAICIGCFFLGALGLRRSDLARWILGPVLAAVVIMIYDGFTQHFGGLEQTREYFWTYIYPTLKNVPPEYLGKMKSNRIFSTVFYPNAFAGALLLVTPPLLAWIWQAKERFTPGARGLLCTLVAGPAAACLYWTGSKGGWLLALLLGAIALLHQKFDQKYKIALIIILLVAGGAGFYWKNRDYMKRGATSVVARFDYWEAAVKTVLKNPLLGSGPGTFANAYEAVRRPDSEMARLTHNDYLQQASDSGFPGFLSYVTFIAGMLWISYRRLDWQQTPILAGVWLGVAAWAIQSAFEFSLYIPSLGWTALALGGWLVGYTRATVGETIRQTP